jgi:hypothetical protein
MFLGAVRFHLRMYTKFGLARNCFRRTNIIKQYVVPYATVRPPAKPCGASLSVAVIPSRAHSLRRDSVPVFEHPRKLPPHQPASK